MDLDRIKAHGTSTTGTAWMTNPIRRALWWLVAPYFQGATIELDKRRQADLAVWREAGAAAAASQLGGARKDMAALAHRLAGLEDAGEEEERARLALGERVDAVAAQAGAAASLLDGARKDMAAPIHRLVRLEDAGEEEAQARLALGERIDAVEAQARETADFIASVRLDVRASEQTPTQRIDAVARGAALASVVQQEMRHQTRALNARMDQLARGAALRAGDRIKIGQDDLMLVATPGGARFLVHQHDLIGHLIADGGEWEPHVRAAIERAARPDGVAVDAGAYIGLHSVTMARWFRVVHAFEPQRGIFQLLCGNLVLNGRANVIAHNLALYDRAGAMRLAPGERQEVETPMLNGQPDYARISNAAALTFDFLEAGAGDTRAVALDDLALDGVALIKVGTQGADLRVVRGAESTIRRCRPTVLFEWERDLGQQHGVVLEDYHAFFACLDYEVAILQETTPGRQADYIARPR
jgi:FkbM family methyltransferase